MKGSKAAVTGNRKRQDSVPFKVTRYAFTPPHWPTGLRLRAVALSDIHACWPWMTRARIETLVIEANALRPDIFFLLGDYVQAVKIFGRPVPHPDFAHPLAGLSAPLGVHAVLGNHDWTDDEGAVKRGAGPTEAGEALEAVSIPVYHNRSVRIEHGGGAFWLAGLESQRAFWLPRKERSRKNHFRGLDDLDGTLAQVTSDEPVILMAHEPDIFDRVPDRVSLTLSGHTHAGQINLFGWTPVVPSYHGTRFLHGHIVEEGRHLIVSAGLGYSGVPLRFMAPPEIVLLDLGA